MRTVKSVILLQFTLLLMTSVSPLGANAAPQRAANFPPDRRDAIAMRCEQLAGSPYDSQKVGQGVPFTEINVAEALPVCQQAAARQPARPRYRFLYGRVLDAAQRFSEAAQQYEAADQGGYALAAVNLGSFYATGQGVVKDLGKATNYFRRAGDAGFPDGYADLGLLSVDSNPPNYTQAFAEFDRAARAGSTPALAYLGELYFNGLGVPKNQARAISLFQQAANRGDPEGILDLGLSYYSGAGVPRDPGTAFRLLSRAAAFGFAQAQDAIAHMYEEGDGVAQSDEQAIAWYRKSVAQNDPFAMTRLAKLLNDAGNSAEAMTVYRRAAELGDPGAMTDLGDLLEDAGNGAEAVDWYRKAAAKGHPDAENRLAYGYFVGKNTLPRDYDQAAFWYGKAVEQGDTFAMVRLGEMYEKGQGVVQNIDVARVLYTRAAADPEIPGRQARYNLEQLDRSAAASAPTPNAPAAATTDTTSGGFGDLIGGGGFIKPAPGYAPPSPPPNEPPRAPVISQRDNTPDPPYRPLPTQPSARSSDDDLAAALFLGAIILGGAWLLSGSSGGSSGGGHDSGVPSSGGGGGFDFSGGGTNYPSAPPSRPVATPMNGDITRTLHGEDALGLNGPVNRR